MNLLMNWNQTEKYINTLTGHEAEEKIWKLNGRKEFFRGDGTRKIEEIGRYLRKIEDWKIFTENKGVGRYLRKMEEIGWYLPERIGRFTENRED